MTQKDGVYFADRDYSVLLHPPESYPDGICYHHYVDIVAGPFHGTIDATSFVKVQALDQFRKELVALYENLTGEAHLKNVYENFKLELIPRLTDQYLCAQSRNPIDMILQG